MAGSRIKGITIEIGCYPHLMNRRLPRCRSESKNYQALFLLRCTEVGISIRDLDLLTIGLVLDMWTEKANDGVKYRRIADQSDFDKF